MRIQLVAAAFLITSCTNALTPAGSTVVEADEKMVAQCTFVGSVSGISMIGNTKAQGMERARNSAKNNAAELGATHVVLGDMLPASGSYNISGKAYRCDGAKTQ